ncbi:MAG: TetR/AcrR family transcriptional regulator [Acidimicrobiia bacterium]
MPPDLRTTVLRSAVDHIAAHGPDSLSMREVARSAGVSHQAPYHHFTDRAGIFEAIAGEGFALLGVELLAALDEPGADPATALLEGYVCFALDNPGHFRVMFRPDLCPEFSDPEVIDAADRTFGVLVDFVRDSLGPDASVDKIRARATAMWAVAHGLATLLIDGPLEKQLGQVSDRRRFIRAVAAQTGLTTRSDS